MSDVDVAADADAVRLAVGSTFGRYRIERELGSGGMGQVFAAYDTLLRRTVALKIVRTRNVEDETAAKEGAARLLREARAAAALRHPNAVAVFDIGETDGIAFIAMELVTGRTLTSYVNSSSSSSKVEQKLAWLLGMSRALAAAHREGIVHRDVKPENVMVCPDGSVKVLDFGIAKRQGHDNAKLAKLAALGDGPPSFKTAEGIVSGTPRYMSPEQLVGGTIDGRSDQFSWAVVAYELLSGVHPQTTTGTAERWGAPPAALPTIAPNVPPALSEIVMRALERWPEHRWPSMDDVVQAIEAYAGIAPAAAAESTSSRLTSDEPPPPPNEPTMRVESPSEVRARAEKNSASTETADALANADTELPNNSDRAADAVGPARKDNANAATLTAPRSIIAGDHAGPIAVGPLLPRMLDHGVRVADPHRPTWRRLAPTAVGLACIFLGFTDMIVEIVMLGATSTPALGAWLIRAGWITLGIAPLLLLARSSRPARVDAREGRLAIRGARGMSQAISPSEITGASFAPTTQTTSTGTTSFSVILMPKRVGATPIAIDNIAREDDGHAILASLGITHARALTGTLSWPLQRGVFDIFKLVIAVTWRVTIVVSNFDIPIVSPLCVALSLLTGLLAGGLAFAPLSGSPHVELTNDQLRLFLGSKETKVIALRDLVSASAEDDAIAFRLRSGDTVLARAPKPLFSRRALSLSERAHLVDHVNAAAARARAAWS